LNSNPNSLHPSGYSGSKDDVSELSEYAATAGSKRMRVDDISGLGATDNKGGLNPNGATEKIHETDGGVELEVVVEEMPKWKVLRVDSSILLMLSFLQMTTAG
jgi:hypothetical protein